MFSVRAILSSYVDKNVVALRGLRNGPCPSYLKPLFQSEAVCKAIAMKTIIYSHVNKTQVFEKGFTCSLVCIVRVSGT